MPDPITDLDRLLASIAPALDPRVFAFTTIPDDSIARVAPHAIMLFREIEVLTAIVERNAARDLGLSATFPCRMITLHVQSSLEAVGFLAAVLLQLSARGMGVNPVSAYLHDHLFVLKERAEEALSVLQDVTANARQKDDQT